MSSIADPQPEPPAEEALVAYLDGELPPEDCRRVEERLATDAGYRQQLHDLDQAWEALNALPATRPDDDFARTTMELVTVAAQGDLSQQTARAAAAGRRRRWGLAAAGVAAALLGFAAARLWLWLGDAAIVADLPVIRHADLLTQIEDVEFLRRTPPAVREQLMNDPTAVDDELSHLAWVGAARREARWDWIDALSPEDQATLASQTKRFKDLPTDQRRRIRELYREVSQADDASELQRTLLAYGQWLGRLTPGDQEQVREELWGLPGDEQIDGLRRFVRQANERASRRLSPEDAETLRRAVWDLVEERRPVILSELRRRDGAERARRLEGPRGALIVLYLEMQNEDRANRARERIVGQLSPEAQEHLEQLSRGRRRVQLWQWVRDSLRPKWGPGELEQFFANELDNNQRERLLHLPPGEMQAELERLYLATELGFRGVMEPGVGPLNPLGPGAPGAFERDRFGPGGSPPPRRDDRRPPSHPGPPDGPPPPRPGDRHGEAI